MTVATRTRPASQCQKPRGWLGRFVLWNMNSRHSKVTDWGLVHVSVHERDTILDVGCGGGRTVSKLAAMATQGKVYGADFSEASVAASERTNARSIEMGHVEIRHASVSQLPFPGRHVRPRHRRRNALLVARLARRHPRNLPRCEARRQTHRHRRDLQRGEHNSR